ncbi:hypothetical protein IIA95_03740 [Patescibacteria group bacterium]|nr:hypothetical protein [Patescibacteria group bacterium]
MTILLIIFLAIPAFLLLLWWVKHGEYPPGQMHATRVVITLLTLPRVVIFQLLVLAVFLLLKFSLWHLFYIYPLIAIGINIQQAKKIVKREKLKTIRVYRDGEVKNFEE